jgi:hypothetical protein
MFNTYQFLFEVSLLVIAYCVAVATLIVTRRRLRPFARNLLIGLILFEIVLAVAHLQVLERGLNSFWTFFLNLQYELTAGAIFSAFQLAFVGLLAFVNGWLTPDLKWWQRAYWLLLTATFIYLGLDEYHAFHETLGGRVPSEFWRIPYAIAGMILFGISVAVYWFGSKIPLRLFVMMFMGLMIAAVSGIGVEEFVLQGYVRNDPDAQWMYVFEETFEMVGTTIVLAGVLSYMQEFVPDEQQATARRFLTIGGAAVVGWYFFAQFMLPGIQADLLAKPAAVEYDDGKITLLAYNVRPARAQPGDEIIVSMYWRANERLEENYSFSVHALQYPNGESVAQNDSLHLGVIPTRAWFPGVVMKQNYYMRLPRSTPTPASLGIMARVWYGPWPLLRPWQDTTGLPVSDFGTLGELAFDAAILERVTVLTSRQIDEPDIPNRYTFPEEGVELVGYSLPQETIHSQTMPISFWWETDRRRSERKDLSQMLHFIPREGDDLYVFDQSPFSGRFPMPYWTRNMSEKSTWRIQLAGQLPPGEYDVYTGIYDWRTDERSKVTNGTGDSLPENIIHLGTVEYVPFDEEVTGPDLETTCFSVANLDLRRNNETDTLIAIDRATAAARVVGPTGTVEVENLTFSADGTTLYGQQEIKAEQRGVFGTIDLRTGLFTARGDAVAPANAPALNPIHGGDTLYDVDGISVDKQTGLVWAITQDAKNHLFQINPGTGEVVRDTFGQGVDYVRVEVEHIQGADFVNVEGFVIHPQTGTFYVLVASEDYVTRLARLDFDTLTQGGVRAVDPIPLRSNLDGQAIRDVEGLTFHRDGTMYVTSSNNSNSEQVYDSLWRVDPETGDAEWIDSIENYVEYGDYESLACYSG